MCSTERKFSRAASATSFTVTSFWKSIHARPVAPVTCQNAATRGGASSALGTSGVGPLIPSSSSAASAASAPLVSAPWVDRTPAAAPATRIPGTAFCAGTKAARPWSQTGRAPR